MKVRGLRWNANLFAWEVPLSRDGLVALVDEIDYERVSKHNWTALSQNGAYRAYFMVGKIPTYLHQFVMQPEKGFEVDHINNNPLDNRRENLRVVTHQQNLANQQLSAASTSGYKGVTLDGRKKKDGTPLTPTWMAQTKYFGKRIYLGKFSSPEAAARAYDRKMVELHGNYAKTNAMLGLLPPDND